jgi:hypothetical protein
MSSYDVSVNVSAVSNLLTYVDAAAGISSATSAEPGGKHANAKPSARDDSWNVSTRSSTEHRLPTQSLAQRWCKLFGDRYLSVTNVNTERGGGPSGDIIGASTAIGDCSSLSWSVPDV